MVSAKKLSLSVTNVIKNLNINLPSPDILSLFTNKRNFNVIFANTRQHSSNTLKNINSQFMKELSFLARFAHFKQNQLVTFTHIFSHNTRKRNFNVMLVRRYSIVNLIWTYTIDQCMREYDTNVIYVYTRPHKREIFLIT